MDTLRVPYRRVGFQQGRALFKQAAKEKVQETHDRFRLIRHFVYDNLFHD